MATINIKIDPVGRVTMTGEGFVGSECETKMNGLERALSGGKPVQREYKDEYYQDAENDQEINQSW